MRRQDQRLIRILTCAAAVPVVLSAAGCSLLSGSGGDDGAASSSPSSAASSAAPAYTKLPDPCHTVSEKTLDALVPEAKSGKLGESDDTSVRGSCSYDSLDNNGVHGSQFRWLNISLTRFDQDAAGHSPDKAAELYYTKQVQVAKAAEDATGVHTAPASGTGGDQATAVAYDLKKKEGTFKQQTVVVRTHNAVVTVDYDGAGLAGEKTPDANDLMKDAQQAAKEVVAAIAAANGSGGSSGSGSGGGSASPSKSSASS